MIFGILATGCEGQDPINGPRREAESILSLHSRRSLFHDEENLDYSASTPIAPEAVEAMRLFLTQHYGNPSSPHWAGVPAKDAVERVQAQVATLLDCDPTEIVFTSGGSESNYHAL